MRLIRSLLLIAALLCIAAAVPAWAQQKTEWTWKDRDGNVKSRADLDEIIRRHRVWQLGFGNSGSRADLSGADLRAADLRGVDLGFSLLRGASFSDADLRDARLNYADLSGATLIGTDLSGAHLFHTYLPGAHFEPKSLPVLKDLATAAPLERMIYDQDPLSLSQLRKQFQDAGYREQERAITCALNRHDGDPSRLREALKRSERMSFITSIIVAGYFRWVAFDLTCEYGLSPGRPLRIVGALWLLFSVVYAVLMHLPGTSGIYFMGTRVWRGKMNTQGLQIRPEPIPTAKAWKKPFLWLRREWRVLRAAMFFSLMSAFNIGFRDINFGRWLRMLTKREYDLKAIGWARTVSGFQSLLSVYLIALWVLSYFGRPFG